MLRKKIPGTEEISEVGYRWVPGTEEISPGYRPDKKILGNDG